MAVNPYIVLDLMKPADVYTDLTPNFQGRVGDSRSVIKIWFKLNGLPYDISDKEITFAGIDPQGHKKIVTSKLQARGYKDDLKLGRVSFEFPAGTFAAPGEWDSDNTFFQVKKSEDGTVLSTINCQLNVLPNEVELGITDEDLVSDFEKIREDAENHFNDLTTFLDNNSNELKRMEASQKSQLQALQAQIDAHDIVSWKQLQAWDPIDLLGTAYVKPGSDLYPDVHVRLYDYGAGVPQDGTTDMAGGTTVYSVKARAVYVSPEEIQVYVSKEEMTKFLPGWEMATPEVHCGQNFAYMTDGVHSLQVELKQAQSIESFNYNPQFVAKEDAE